MSVSKERPLPSRVVSFGRPAGGNVAAHHPRQTMTRRGGHVAPAVRGRLRLVHRARSAARSCLSTDSIDRDAAVVHDEHRIVDGAEIGDRVAIGNDQVCF